MRPKYNSQELDEETNFYFYNARYYDPQIARFVTADNVIDGEGSTQGWNRYAYCHNNPIRYSDPTGHRVTEKELQTIESETKAKTKKGHDIAQELIKNNTDKEGNRKFITNYKVKPGDNLTHIAEGFNEYYRTNIFTSENIHQQNIKSIGENPNKIKAGSNLKIDPSEIIINNEVKQGDITLYPSDKLKTYNTLFRMGNALIKGAEQATSDFDYPDQGFGQYLQEKGLESGNKKIGHSPDLWAYMKNDRESLTLQGLDSSWGGWIRDTSTANQKNLYKNDVRNYYDTTGFLPTFSEKVFKNDKDINKTLTY